MDASTNGNREEMEFHLEEVLSSGFFARKANAAILLRFLVKCSLNGETRGLSRLKIKEQCFPGHADEQIVSTEKRRLQKSLREYYESEGIGAAMQFVIQPASFAVSLKRREVAGLSELASALIGRSEQLNQLANGLTACCRGEFRLTMISGEPGCGKTALVEAHVAQIRQNGPASNIALARPTSQPYLPIEEAFLSLLESSKPSRRQSAIGALEKHAPGWLSRMTRDAGKTPSPPLSKDQLHRFLSALSADHPTSLVLEDVHKSDHSTFLLIESLSRQQPRGLHLIITFRLSELQGLNARIPYLVAHQGVHHFEICALTLPEVRDLLSARLPNHLLIPEVASILYQVTAGNPLYLTVVLENLVRGGILRNDGGRQKNRWRLAEPLNQVAKVLPADLMASISSSLDALSGQERSLLLAAALQGERFESAVVAQTIERDAIEVEDGLERLSKSSGLIQLDVRRFHEPILPSVAYRFRHSLYQTAALDGFAQQPSRRKKWSLLAARSMMTIFPNDSGLWNGIVASLLCSSGEFQEALPYFVDAARQSLKSYLHYTCQQTAREGVRVAELCKADGKNEGAMVELMSMLAVSTLVTKGFSDPDVPLLFSRAIEIAERRQFHTILPSLLYGQWISEGGKGNFRGNLKNAERLELLSKSKGGIALGISHFTLGNFHAATDHFQRAVENSATPSSESDSLFIFQIEPRIASRTQAARAAALTGRFDEGRRLAREAIDIALSLDNPHAACYAYTMAAGLALHLGDFEECRSLIQHSFGPAADYGFMQELIWSTVIDSYAADAILPNAANRERAIQAIEMYEHSGCLVAITELKAMLGSSYVIARDAQKGLEVVENALGLATRTEERYFLAELLRLKGEVLVQLGSFAAAADAFDASMNEARNQGARLFELKAVTSRAEFASSLGVDEGLAKSGLEACIADFSGENAGVLTKARNVLLGGGTSKAAYS